MAALLVAALWLGASPARAIEQVFNMLDVQLEGGAAVTELRVSYETYGTLSAARDNAILLIPSAIGDRHEFDPMIGAGKTFDTDKYFVITADPIGGGGSSSPADGLGQDFPRYTIRDMMMAEHALVTQGLEIPRLRALGGRSLGSFVALEWGIRHPETVSSLILLGPTPKADAAYQLTIDLLTSVIALDPEWQGGRYTRNPIEGLRHGGMLFYPWSVSAAHIEGLSPRQLAQELETTARIFAEWDANALVMRFAAGRGHDSAAGAPGDIKAALAQVTAPTLLLVSSSDRLIDPGGARRIRDGIKHPVYAEIASDLGNRALRADPATPEGQFIDRQIRAILADTAPPSR